MYLDELEQLDLALTAMFGSDCLLYELCMN